MIIPKSEAIFQFLRLKQSVGLIGTRCMGKEEETLLAGIATRKEWERSRRVNKKK